MEAVEAPAPTKRSKAEAYASKPASKKPKTEKVKPEPAKAQQSSGSKATAAVDLTAEDEDREILLGHVVSRCVGIQHYHGNGMRYNKEPLHLRRQPNNRYDPNAIAVYTVPGAHAGGGRQVGHVEAKSGDVAAITRVADGVCGIKLIGQVESGAGQVYKFPLRVSFFGRAADAIAVRQLLGYQLTLHAPKPRALKKARSGAGAAKTSAAPPKSGGVVPAASTAGGAAVEDDEDAIEFTGERSWEERDKELRAHAIVLD